MKFFADPSQPPIVKLGVAVLIEDSAGALLLELRRDCRLWGLPGGRVEAGESIEAAALREAKEETNLEVRVTELQGVYSRPEERIVTYADNGDVRHLVDIAIKARIESGRLALSEESLQLKFFKPDELPARESIVPPARRIIADYLAGGKGIIQ